MTDSSRVIIYTSHPRSVESFTYFVEPHKIIKSAVAIFLMNITHLSLKIKLGF